MNKLLDESGFMKGQIPFKIIFYVVGIIFAFLAYSFVKSQVLSTCEDCGIMSDILGILSFAFVLAFFVQELRVFLKVIFKLPF